MREESKLYWPSESFQQVPYPSASSGDASPKPS